LTFGDPHFPWARLNELAYQSDGFDFGGLIQGESIPETHHDHHVWAEYLVN